ncbi:hypothetical protein D3C87_12620 [compost metagenome]
MLEQDESQYFKCFREMSCTFQIFSIRASRQTGIREFDILFLHEILFIENSGR